MRPRGLVVAWVLVAVVFLVLLIFEFSKWRSVITEAARVAGERQRLSAEIDLKEQQVVTEMRRHSALLQEMLWTSVGGDPSAFLTRLAELAQEKRMKVTTIGPLERQATPQFTKSWHTIQVQAPYREVREMAARVEQEKGILEDLHLEPVPSPAGQPAGPLGAGPLAANEVQARFRMTAIELSAPAKRIVERTAASSGGAAQTQPGAPLVLPVPPRVAQAAPAGRDPFFFSAPPAPPAPPRPATPTSPGGPAAPGGPGVAGAPAPEKPRVPLDVKGIVSFPGGFLAIVNNQIVKVGDTVSGHRVERITESAVTLREPGASPFTIELPDLLGAAPAAPKR